MNIFYTDHSPYVAAQGLPDKLVVKMILECAQMLSTAHHVLDGDAARDADKLCKCTHTNHPSSVWVRECRSNYVWLQVHFNALCAEYTRRYGKVHLTQKKLSSILTRPPVNIPDNPEAVYDPATNKLTTFGTPIAQCMPEQFRSDDPVASYRAYVQATKHYAAWTKDPASRPEWWVNVPTKEEAENNLK